jgi:DNA replication protein DnaC
MTTPRSADSWRPTLDEHESTLRNAADACAQLIAEMESGASPRWLTLNGEAGCGKTMLARQVYIRSLPLNPGGAALWVDPEQMAGGRAKRRPRCVWLDAGEMAERMKGGEFDLPEYLADDFLVVLDDLGAARDKTDFMADAVYRLCQQRRESWTLFTSNLTMREIAERVDERVASRLIRDRNVHVRITAGDYALKAKKPTTRADNQPIGVQTYPRPQNWENWLKTAYKEDFEGRGWAHTAICLGWEQMPSIWRQKIAREFGEMPRAASALG